MIDIAQAAIGLRVRYTSEDKDTVDEGAIVSWNEDYVFVRYDKRISPIEVNNSSLPKPHSRVAKDSPGVATDPANLEFV